MEATILLTSWPTFLFQSYFVFLLLMFLFIRRFIYESKASRVALPEFRGEGRFKNRNNSEVRMKLVF